MKPTFLPTSDINECATDQPCDTNAVCTDTVGSYTCTCAEGFTGDGVTCTSSTGTGEGSGGSEGVEIGSDAGSGSDGGGKLQ